MGEQRVFENKEKVQVVEKVAGSTSTASASKEPASQRDHAAVS